MARTTTNYGWNISEGSDLVNPLTDIFPNFESLDTDLKEVSDASIGEATELKTGTVHALTRTDTDKDVFKFTATSNFTAGDTFTVDTEQVSALTTSGEQLTTGCYIIGSEVLVAKKGTLLTFYISNVITDASTLEGHSASYFAAASDLADTNNDVLSLSNKVGSAILTTEAQDCSGAINELHDDLSSLGSAKIITCKMIGSTGVLTIPIHNHIHFAFACGTSTNKYLCIGNIETLNGALVNHDVTLSRVVGNDIMTAITPSISGDTVSINVTSTKFDDVSVQVIVSDE